MTDNRNTGEISDGYHTFNELYEHRHLLFCNLLTALNAMKISGPFDIFKTRKSKDGKGDFDGYFIAGIISTSGQVSYHLPNKYWDCLSFVKEKESFDEYDGHSSSDVLTVLKAFVGIKDA